MKKTQNSNRSERIASAVRRHVAEITAEMFAEDRVMSGISIVGAESHGGLQFARLWYCIRQKDAANLPEVQKRLNSAAPAIRRELARRMNQKYVPELHFVHDDTLEKSARIEELLKSMQIPQPSV